MKRIIKLTLIAALTVFNFGCGEDFLEKEPSEFLTTVQLEEAASRNPDVIAGTMNGIYALMFETETGGTTGDDDFGHNITERFFADTRDTTISACNETPRNRLPGGSDELVLQTAVSPCRQILTRLPLRQLTGDQMRTRICQKGLPVQLAQFW